MRLNDKIAVQFCLAHVIRDVRYVTTVSDQDTNAYGERLRAGLQVVFDVIHRREEMSLCAFQHTLTQCRDSRRGDP